MRNKKSQTLLYGLLAGLLGAIIVSVISDSTKDFDMIGQSSLALISVSKQAEKVLFYIDQSAKYALQQAVYDLAQKGGASDVYDSEDIDSSGVDIAENNEVEIKDCWKFNNANIWYEIKKTPSGNYEANSCFDENFAGVNLEYIFNKHLNQYLIKYPGNILTDNYNYQIQNNLEILGLAIEPLKFDILKNEARAAIKEQTEIEKQAETGVIQIENFVDFTGTELCKKGARCLLTKEAYQLLAEAQEKAKEKGVSLVVTKGYRTLPEQVAEWKINPNRKEVCPPSPTCPHLSGKVVDVRFKDKTRDTMTRNDWKSLHEIMSQAGWVRYGNEEWHFECCGTNRYARAKAQGVDVIV